MSLCQYWIKEHYIRKTKRARDTFYLFVKRSWTITFLSAKIYSEQNTLSIETFTSLNIISFLIEQSLLAQRFEAEENSCSIFMKICLRL